MISATSRLGRVMPSKRGLVEHESEPCHRPKSGFPEPSGSGLQPASCGAGRSAVDCFSTPQGRNRCWQIPAGATLTNFTLRLFRLGGIPDGVRIPDRSSVHPRSSGWCAARPCRQEWRQRHSLPGVGLWRRNCQPPPWKCRPMSWMPAQQIAERRRRARGEGDRAEQGGNPIS